MENTKKIKIFIGTVYFVLVSLFLYFLLSNFSIQEISSYEFIKNNRDFFFELKEKNYFLISILFLIFCIVWTLAGGFGTPIILFSGFLFGKWIGTILLIIGMTVGATLLYIFANFFLKEFIREKFLKKFSNLESKFKKSEFLYLLIYRFVGGIPFAISNVLPCIFNVKVKNFFWATFIGMLPPLFVVASIASGLEKIIDENLEMPHILDIIFEQEIYLPLIAFFCLLLITILCRKIFYKK